MPLRTQNFVNTLMGLSAGEEEKTLTNFETRWLDKHHFFNDTHIKNNVPQFIEYIGAEAIGPDIVRFKVKFRDNSGLHHCQIIKGFDILGDDVLQGVTDTAEIDVKRWTVYDGDKLKFVVMDTHGNTVFHDIENITLPDQPVSEHDGKLEYLTIKDKSAASLIPINNSDEWCGWENAGVFEKTPTGVAPQLPNWYIHVPKLDEWKSWFYSHAKSRFVYDISAGEYNQFVADFYLPNPCGATASVQVYCFADDEEIYRSEVLRSPAAQNKSFLVDIPKDTQTFTIEITDAGDGISCDHFIFGNARVLNVPVQETKDPDNIKEVDVVCVNCNMDEEVVQEIVGRNDLSVDPQNKLTTSWAAIKIR